MQIDKQFTLFGFQEGWPWWLVTAGFVAAFVAVVTHTTVLPPILISALAALSAVWITVYRYVRRWRFLRSIRFFTGHGMAVIYATEAVKELQVRISAKDMADLTYLGVQEACDRVALNPQQVRTYQGKPKLASDLAQIFRHIAMTVTTQPIELPGQKVWGFHQLNQIFVSWVESRMDRDTFQRLVRHEAGHACLEACGVPASFHHELMAQIGIS